MKRTHNKLVRDRIPEIITANGEQPTLRILDEPAYLEALIAKLHEEVAEFIEARSIEELADVQEVVLALATAIGLSPADLERARVAKATKNGAFNQRIFLESTE